MNKVKKARQKLGFSQSQFAKLIHAGFFQQISAWENEYKQPNQQLLLLCDMIIDDDLGIFYNLLRRYAHES